VPKVSIVFDLPEESNEYLITTHALDWALVACDIDTMLRVALKHGHQYESADEALEAVRKELWDFMNDHSVSLEMIE